MTDLLGVMESWQPPRHDDPRRGRLADRDRAGRHRVRQAGAAATVDPDAGQRRAGLPAVERVLAGRAHRAGRRLAAPCVRRVQRPRELGDGRGRPGRAVRRRRRAGGRVLRRARPAGVGAGRGRLRHGVALRGRRLDDGPARRGRLALPAGLGGAGLARGAPAAARRPARGSRVDDRLPGLARQRRRARSRTPRTRRPCSTDRPTSASCPCWRTTWSWPRAGSPCDGDWAGITDVWVSPDHRRRRLGLVVVAELLEWSAERGAGTTYLQVRGDNAPGLALYEGLGFAHPPHLPLPGPGGLTCACS